MLMWSLFFYSYFSLISADFLLELDSLKPAPQSTTSGWCRAMRAQSGWEKCSFLLIVISNITAIYCFFVPGSKNVSFFLFFLHICKDEERWQKGTARDGWHIWAPSLLVTTQPEGTPHLLLVFPLLLCASRDTVCFPSDTLGICRERGRERLSVCALEHVSLLPQTTHTNSTSPIRSLSRPPTRTDTSPCSSVKQTAVRGSSSGVRSTSQKVVRH